MRDLCIDLPRALRADLGNRPAVNVLAVSRIDEDHCRGIKDLFRSEHAEKGEPQGAIAVRELWVPAALITEDEPSGEVLLIQREARKRLLDGRGIRVFSHPSALEDWCAEQEEDLAERKHLIVDAACLVPSLSFDRGGVEIFVHSPFAERAGSGDLAMRNATSLAFIRRSASGASGPALSSPPTFSTTTCGGSSRSLGGRGGITA